MRTDASLTNATLRKMTDNIFDGRLDRWLRIIAKGLQSRVKWSLTALDSALRSAKVARGTSDKGAAEFVEAPPQPKLWYLLALMSGFAVLAPQVVLPRAPFFLGAICAFNAVMGTVLVVKARRL